MGGYKNRKWLYQKYVIEKLSTPQIGKIVNRSNQTIQYWLKKFKIKMRGVGSHSKSGSKNPRWKGGRNRSFHGYILVYKPEHPFSYDNYVPEHRLMAEKALGRYLKSDEVVHHINGKKDDNRNSNFVICTRGYNRWLQDKMAQLYMKEHFS